MPKKILIVEDEEYLSEMYKIRFVSEGYEVIIADNGEEGLKLAQTKKPDLILLDLVMPKMDGYQVLEKLKENKETRDIKVYVFSNLGQSDEIKKGMSEGADGFLVKANMTPTQIVSFVNDVFKNKGSKKSVDADGLKKKDTLHIRKDINGRKVLLIEDEVAILEMYKLRLEKEGYTVETAANGAWGLKLAREKEFDIILMDIVMPAMDGCEMLRELKKDSKNRKAPIMVLSNSAQDQDIDRAIKCGATGFLLKAKTTPVNLIAEIDRVFSSLKKKSK